jgi:hypothetical protein
VNLFFLAIYEFLDFCCFIVYVCVWGLWNYYLCSNLTDFHPYQPMGCDDKQSVMHRQPPTCRIRPITFTKHIIPIHPQEVTYWVLNMALTHLILLPLQFVWPWKHKLWEKSVSMVRKNLGQVLLCGLWSMIRAVRSYCPFCPTWPRAHIRGQNSPNPSTLFENKLFNLTTL